MLGITVERGKIVEWMKKEGDPVEKAEIIFIVEVEKATTEVESPASGILAKILVGEGVEVPVLTVVGLITEPGEEVPAGYAIQDSERTAVPAESGVETTSLSGPPTIPAQPAPAYRAGKIKAMPAARHLAGKEGLDLGTVAGSGPEGVILFRDVEAALQVGVGQGVKVSTLAQRLAKKAGVPLEQVEGSGIRERIMRADVTAYLEKTGEAGPEFGATIPMGSIRKVIARRMSESAFTAPHITFFTEVWLDPLLKLRKVVVPDFEKKFDLRPSINDFLIKAVALNIIDFPLLNAQLKGDEIQVMPEINIGLATALPEGLIVPAIPKADRLGIVEIARQRINLVGRSREGKLTLEEMERGTFTVSSLAQYDITHFTAILNPPQSGILCVGKTDEKLVMVDGRVEVKRISRLGLSVDHRIIDGALAADFLQHLKWKLERPSFTFLTL